MDGDRFDDIVRSLASGSSRRRFLKGLGLGTAAVAGGRAAGADAAPTQQVRICVPARKSSYVEKYVASYLVPVYRLMGAFIPAPGASCSKSCVPQANAVTCAAPREGTGASCVPRINNCGTLVTCGSCGAGHFCNEEGYCQEGCKTNRDCAAFADACNSASCDNHVCVQTHINESYKCAESDTPCAVWECKQGVCGRHVHVTAQTPCGDCMKCTYDGECVPVPNNLDPFDHCRGLQYCQDGVCTGCIDDDSCGEGEICNFGHCVEGCTVDAQCAMFANDCNDSICYENQCILVPAHEGGACVAVSPVYFEGYCQAGVCRECLEDAHCPANTYCNREYLNCRPGCRNDEQCIDQAGPCSTAVCSDGSCLKQATNEGADCPGGTCVNGTCSDNGFSTPTT